VRRGFLLQSRETKIQSKAKIDGANAALQEMTSTCTLFAWEFGPEVLQGASKQKWKWSWTEYNSRATACSQKCDHIMDEDLISGSKFGMRVEEIKWLL